MAYQLIDFFTGRHGTYKFDGRFRKSSRIHRLCYWSAFTELGKTKAFRKMAKNVEREEVLENLGEECYLDKDMF